MGDEDWTSKLPMACREQKSLGAGGPLGKRVTDAMTE